MGPAGYYDPRTGAVAAPSGDRAVVFRTPKVVKKPERIRCLFLGGQENEKFIIVPALRDGIPVEQWKTIDKGALGVIEDKGPGFKTYNHLIYERHKVKVPGNRRYYVFVLDAMFSMFDKMAERAYDEGLFDGY